MSKFSNILQRTKEIANILGDRQPTGVLPWKKQGLDDSIRNWIMEETLQLSLIHEFFLRPPSGLPGGFRVNIQELNPLIDELIKIDPNLKKMKSILVPEFSNEQSFWTNYFGRLYLIELEAEKKNKIIQENKSKQRIHDISSYLKFPQIISIFSPSNDHGEQDQEKQKSKHNINSLEKQSPFSIQSSIKQSSSLVSHHTEAQLQNGSQSDYASIQLNTLNTANKQTVSNQKLEQKQEQQQEQDLSSELKEDEFLQNFENDENKIGREDPEKKTDEVELDELEREMEKLLDLKT